MDTLLSKYFERKKYLGEILILVNLHTLKMVLIMTVIEEKSIISKWLIQAKRV